MTYYPITISSTISKGYGYLAGGWTGGSTMRSSCFHYDDVANVWKQIRSLSQTRGRSAGFALNNYGYAVKGYNAQPLIINEKYDNILNIWTIQTSTNTSLTYVSGFYLNGYGYICGGENITPTVSAVVEKYDDVLNTWTTKTSLNTARTKLSGFSLSGYGYTSGGDDSIVYTGATEKYDDINNTWTAKANLNTARITLAAFSLNGFGYTSGGDTGAASAVTEKYDDLNNTWTAKANLNNAQSNVNELSLNGYGYLASGSAAKVEKYNDVLNTWTVKGIPADSNKDGSTFTLRNLSQSIQNPDIQEIIKHSIKEMIPVDQTASRAIDGTVYTNTASSNIFVTVSARCIIDTAADAANIQAFSDTNADPVAAASGIVGIQGGLAGEDKTTKLSFVVRPYEKYKVVKTISAGCTATLGKWFETILK